MFESPVGRLLSGPVAALESGVRAWTTQPVDWDRMDEARLVPMSRAQTTIERPVTVTGRGTFFGKSLRTLTLCPTDMEGWWFERTRPARQPAGAVLHPQRVDDRAVSSATSCCAAVRRTTTSAWPST